MKHSILQLYRRPSIDTYIVYQSILNGSTTVNHHVRYTVYDGARTYCLLLPIVEYYSYVLFSVVADYVVVANTEIS